MRLFIFISCLSCGILSGIVYDILYVIRCGVCGVQFKVYTTKDKIFTAICDIIYFVIFAGAYIFLSVIFEFEQIRFYMLLGCGIGIILYLKSFHVIVAFFVKKIYNNLNARKRR